MLAALPICALTAGHAPRSARAEAVSPRAGAAKEYEVKAAFVYNFLVYTTWAKGSFDSKDAPIELLIVGKDPFGDVIDKALKGKQIDGRTVRIERAPKLPEKLGMHVVYCGDLNKKEREEIISKLAKKPVLLIGEHEGFAEAGGIINFYIDKSNVRFEINTGAASLAGITLSSQLLKLAKIVKTREKGK